MKYTLRKEINLWEGLSFHVSGSLPARLGNLSNASIEKDLNQGFHGSVVKESPCQSTGETRSLILILEELYAAKNNLTPQLLSLCSSVWEPQPLSPHVLQLLKAHASNPCSTAGEAQPREAWYTAAEEYPTCHNCRRAHAYSRLPAQPKKGRKRSQLLCCFTVTNIWMGPESQTLEAQ